jgi:hypothetical protein
MSITQEHYNLFLAIEMWVSTLIKLCDENTSDSHTRDYSYFIANVLNGNNNPHSEAHIKQAIDDFYDYFYINQHICDVNSMSTYGEIDNNYGIGEHKLRLLDTLTKIETDSQSKSVFQTITIYVFQMCRYSRKKLDLTIFDAEKDTQIVIYFTRQP